MTCFLVVVHPSSIHGFAVAPLLPEHKLQWTEQATRIEASTCGTNTLTPEDLHDEWTFHRPERLAAYVAQQQNHRHLLSVDLDGCEVPSIVVADQYVQVEFLSASDCVLAWALDLALQPDVCFVGAYPAVQLRNDLASGIVQGGGSVNSKPFYDVGLDGSGQIVAVSDTGVDLDNCYFRDTQHQTPKGTSGAFEPEARKVVQYYSFKDGTDYASGHGTHVAGSIAGRRSTNGVDESDGAGDGVARGAKLAVVDIGDAIGRLSLPSIPELFGAGRQAGAKIHSASWGTANSNGYTNMDRAMDEFM